MGDQSPPLASDRHIQFKVLAVGFIIPGNPLNVLDSVARASLSLRRREGGGASSKPGGCIASAVSSGPP